MNILRDERGNLIYTLMLAIILPIVSISVLSLITSQILFDRNSALNHKAEYIAQGAMDALNDYLMAQPTTALHAFNEWIDDYSSPISYEDANGAAVQVQYSELNTNVSLNHFGYQVTATVTSGNQSVERTIRYEFPISRLVNGGIYKIVNVSNNRVLDRIDKWENTDQHDVIVATANGSNSQKWKVINVEDVNGNLTYKLINMEEGQALDIPNANSNPGVNIQITWDNYSNAQKWQFIYKENGTFAMLNPQSGNVLEDDGARVQTNVDNGSLIQRWRFELVEAPVDGELISNGTYTVVHPYTGQVLDLHNNNSTHYPLIIKVTDYNGTSAQRWNLVENGDGTYQIVLLSNGWLLDVINGQDDLIAAADRIGVQIEPYNGTVAQKWTIIPDSNSPDTYNIIYRYGTEYAKYLNVNFMSSNPSRQVDVYKYYYANAQQWQFRQLQTELPDVVYKPVMIQ